MIDILFAFIFGFLICAALWALRERERSRAFEAAIEQNRALREKAETLAARHAKIQDLIREAKLKGIFALGGSAPLPAPAESSNGQLTSVRVTTKLRGASGPLRNGGPDFSGGGNER
jgi:cbb3-type cytochrome oxidase subunit 3